jgi:hypothetical protein
MTSGFEVSSDVLRRFGDVLDEQALRLGQIQRCLADVHVGSDAFGHLPSAAALWQQYDTHAQEESQNLGEAAGLLQDSKDDLTRNAADYDETEQHVTDMHQNVMRTM